MNRNEAQLQTIDVHSERGPATSRGTRKLAELIHDLQTAMVITATAGKHFRGRPMAVLQSELEDELWFYTDARSGLVDDITENHQMSVCFMDPARQRFVSVSGVAHVVREASQLRKLWNSRAAEWFPDGPETDPNLALIRIQLEEAEYWDAPSRSMVKLFGFATSEEREVDVTNSGRAGEPSQPGSAASRAPQ